MRTRGRELGWGVGLLLAALVGLQTPTASAADTDDAEKSTIRINTFKDIFTYLPPPGAKKWDPQPLVEAIGASSFAFTPNHYYELLDKHVHPDVVKMVAAKAAVFHDPNALALDDLQERSRQGQTKVQQSIGPSNFVELFEFFNDAKNDLDTAEARVGPPKPQQPSESVSVFERRTRARIEKLVAARGPIEGRIEGATFLLDLPATVTERDGCRRSVATVEMEDLTLDLFRVGAGSTATRTPVEIGGSPSLELVQFTIESPKRFEAIGRCGTTGTRLRLSMHRSWDGHWSATGGF